MDGPLKDLTDAAEARADDLKAAVGKVKITVGFCLSAVAFLSLLLDSPYG